LRIWLISGTVIGIVRSFGVIAIDAAASRPTMLAQGIGEALIATATGLLVGIPAMAAYAYFRGRVHALISELEAASTQLLALLSSVGVKSAPAGVQAESVEVS
jgi:biopolymer transport protein ExbB